MEIARSVRASSVAELFWTDPDGAPDGRGVVALSWGETPVVAFTYALELQARAAASSPLVALTLTERRSTGAAFEPVALVGRPRLVEDLDGTAFAEHLLAEELRRFPPARKFADSAMLRREHWWYLPRLIVTVDVVSVRPLPERTSPDEHMLAVALAEGLGVHVVRPTPPQPRTGDPLSLTASASDTLPSGPAALVGQDASFPDLEQWRSWCFRGECDGARLAVTGAAPTVGLPPTPSLWRRMRTQGAFGRACRAGIRRAEGRR